jgi:glycosyltransferase involved in cell wall biosynthesis
MKVALITSWNERCGIAEYAKNLITNCPTVEFEIIPREVPIEVVRPILEVNDIISLNYEPGILGHWNEKVIRSLNKPSVLTLHTSHDGNNSSELTSAFTRVVVHEQTQEGFTFIPMGIPKPFHEDGVTIHFDVGTVGFPFPWKGFNEVVLACKKINASCLVIAPESRHADTEGMEKHLKSLYSNVTYISEWFDQNQVISLLEGCSISAFLYHGGNYGISAACRLGLAARTKIVLTRNRQFRDLYSYEDEIQFVSNPPNIDEVANTFHYLLSDRITMKPKRVLEDYSWNKAGEMYTKLYEELLNG